MNAVKIKNILSCHENCTLNEAAHLLLNSHSIKLQIKIHGFILYSCNYMIRKMHQIVVDVKFEFIKKLLSKIQKLNKNC